MDKLAIQVTVAILVVLQARRLEWPWWAILVTVIVAGVVVHLVYDFVYDRLSGSSRHLGAAAISNDDPLMIAAFEEAETTWPQFLELFRQYPKDSLVKYRLQTESGDIENVWGDLIDLDGDTATVYLRTPPVGDLALEGPRMTIAATDIVDWQVMVSDGTLRGGFTQQATFRIIEREGGVLPRGLARQLERYRPLSRPAV